MMMFEKDDASSLSHDGIKSLLAYGSQVTTEQLHTKDERKQEILKPLFKKKKRMKIEVPEILKIPPSFETGESRIPSVFSCKCVLCLLLILPFVFLLDKALHTKAGRVVTHRGVPMELG